MFGREVFLSLQCLSIRDVFDFCVWFEVVLVREASGGGRAFFSGSGVLRVATRGSVVDLGNVLDLETRLPLGELTIGELTFGRARSELLSMDLRRSIFFIFGRVGEVGEVAVGDTSSGARVSSNLENVGEGAETTDMQLSGRSIKRPPVLS